jgi:hypothetical protein
MSKQLLIKEVLNTQFYNYTTGSPIFYADYMSNSTIETTSERLDIRGGQGNYIIGTFDHTKTCMFKCEMPVVDMEFLAELTGKSLNTGSVQINNRETLIVNASNQVTLAATPVEGTLRIYLKEGDRDNGTEQVEGTPVSNQNQYSITGNLVTLNATTCPDGTEIFVYYDYMTSATSRTITFTADKFPGYVRAVGTGIVTDQVTGAERVVKFDVKKCKPATTFSITQSSTEATKLTMDFAVYSTDVVNNDGTTDKVYVSMTEII